MTETPGAPSVVLVHDGGVIKATGQLADFVRNSALPLWSTAGFDLGRKRFHERLDYASRPIALTAYRLMVQARQVAIYARATLLGWQPSGRALANSAFQSMMACYRSPDEQPGWVFSVDEEGRPADATRDLYAHAFVVFACAWLYRLTSDPTLIVTADATLSDIERIFAVEGLGYASRRPEPADAPREQNPHMHLFEALLALAEVSGADRHMGYARHILGLFDRAFTDPVTGAVRETFNSTWRPNHAPGKNPVEPGHQFEWAWLLGEYERLSGEAVRDRVERLFAHALAFGVDAKAGLVRDVIREDGRILSTASRVWPQTEAFRALAREVAGGRPNTGTLAARIANRLLDRHCPSTLRGGWVDRLDEIGQPAAEFQPASTLYHIAAAAMDSSLLLAGDSLPVGDAPTIP